MLTNLDQRKQTPASKIKEEDKPRRWVVSIRASQKVARPGRVMVAAEAESRSVGESGQTSRGDVARGCSLHPCRRTQVRSMERLTGENSELTVHSLALRAQVLKEGDSIKFYRLNGRTPLSWPIPQFDFKKELAQQTSTFQARK